MSEKHYQIEIIVYGPDSWFDPNKVASRGGYLGEPWKTLEFIFYGSKEELEFFIDDKLDDIDAMCGGRGSLNYDLYVEEIES